MSFDYSQIATLNSTAAEVIKSVQGSIRAALLNDELITDELTSNYWSGTVVQLDGTRCDATWTSATLRKPTYCLIWISLRNNFAFSIHSANGFDSSSQYDQNRFSRQNFWLENPGNPLGLKIGIKDYRGDSYDPDFRVHKRISSLRDPLFWLVLALFNCWIVFRLYTHRDELPLTVERQFLQQMAFAWASALWWLHTVIAAHAPSMEERRRRKSLIFAVKQMVFQMITPKLMAQEDGVAMRVVAKESLSPLQSPSLKGHIQWPPYSPTFVPIIRSNHCKHSLCCAV